MPTNTDRHLSRFQRRVAVASATLAAAAAMTVVPAGSALAATPVPAGPTAAKTQHAQISPATRRARAAHRAAVQRNHREVRALSVAADHRGAPYVYGAAGPTAFDCSGLTQFALSHAGVRDVARTAAAQASQARRISRAALRPGDLIFFDSGNGVYHVAFFVRWDDGEAIILHAPHSGASVTYATVWTNDWFAGTYR